MPYPRGKYKDKVDAELPQVFINYCLVRYRTLTNTEPYKKHWKGEMRNVSIDKKCDKSHFLSIGFCM